ncbi:hypothetical protein H2204_010269 [Knufia peltigerae]|uniref:AB hydrolase-1 domain-containing protein n=1 Tax=Knufia peltigerae TaxID=1002370 RepID=A0AA38XWS4_9EURO|nr:hypothetical protein H2204_010269 [Knufia peltigerae]
MPIRKAYVDVTGGQLHYHYIGNIHGQHPPLVFTHMTADSAHSFDLLMEELDGKWPCIAFDTPNYGESFKTTREPSIMYISEVLLEALSAINVGKFHIFGHHTGVSTAAEMCIQAPTRTVSYIPNGPNFCSMDDTQRIREKLSKPNPISTKGTQLMWAWSRIKDNYPDSMHDTPAPNAAEVMHRSCVDMLRAGPNWNWGYEAIFTYNTVEAISKVKCPIFFVCGDRDPAYRLHERAVAAYPQHASHVCPGAGTYYNETHPDELAPVLLKWVTSLSRSEQMGRVY